MKRIGKVFCLGLFSLMISSCGGKDEPKKIDPVNPGGGGQEQPHNGGNEVTPFTGDQDKGSETPLTFVSRYTLNKSGKGFVKTHAIKLDAQKRYERVYANYSDTEVGYFTVNQAKKMFAQPVKIDGVSWHIPSKKEWGSILYGDYFEPNVKFSVVSLSGNAKEITKKLDVTEAVTVQGENFNCKADYLTKIREGGKHQPNGFGKRFVYVTYAHRFKGTRWNSAWRYSLDYKRKGVKVECVALKDSKGIDDIQSAKFFTDNPSTVRFFPLYGGLVTKKSKRIDKLGAGADYIYLGLPSGAALWSVDEAGLIKYGHDKKVIRPFTFVR